MVSMLEAGVQLGSETRTILARMTPTKLPFNAKTAKDIRKLYFGLFKAM